MKNYDLKYVFRLNKIKKRKSFTLAEVLIVLTVIGIIASLTVPSVIKNYRKRQIEIGLKKAYVTLKNGLNQSSIKNGNPKKWVFSDDWINRYFIPYLKISKYCRVYTTGCFASDVKFINGDNATDTTISALPSIILSDGMMLKFYRVQNDMLVIYVDINGFKKPNTIGVDIFTFHMGKNIQYGQGNYAGGAEEERPVIYPDGFKMNLITSPYRSCTKEEGLNYSGHFCADMIIRNGWKIPSEYEYYSKSRFFGAGNGTINKAEYKYPW